MTNHSSKKYLVELTLKAGENLGFNIVKFDFSVPEAKFGDYATNAALILGKELKRNSKEIATILAGEIKKIDESNVIKECNAVGGFINFFLSDQELKNNISSILEEKEKFGNSEIGLGKKVIFEYSSPNTNKPLHIGHTRNDVYGKSCINLLKSQGYEVLSCEIINDRGIHIMKSMLMYLKYGNGKTPESERIKPDHFVGKYYQMFAKEAAVSPEAEKQLLEEAQSLLQKWEAGDLEVRKVWQRMNDWFYEGIKQTYELEGSDFDEVNFESQIYDKGREIVLQGVDSGIFLKEQDGSISVDFTNIGLDKKTLLRKDGTTLYITQDMYLWNLRNQKHKPNLAVVTTSAEQAYHFKVLKNIFLLLKFSWAENFKHLPYEHVFLGKNKMSSREGNTITADELVETVKGRIIEVMKNSAQVKASINNNKLIKDIAFGAIKYGYLKYEPNTRIYFDLEQTISIEGNTGPYIQYAFARISSILKKTDMQISGNTSQEILSQENALLRKLLHFKETVELATVEYKPNLLCNYLYELAGIFNHFYHEVPVLLEESEDKKTFRLGLISATAQVLKNGLCLLGIEAPQEM